MNSNIHKSKTIRNRDRAEDLVEIKSPSADTFDPLQIAEIGNDGEYAPEMFVSDEEPDEELEKIKNKVYIDKDEAYKDIEEVFLELENDKYFSELADPNSNLKQPSTELNSQGRRSKLPLRPSPLPHGLLNDKLGKLGIGTDGKQSSYSTSNPTDSSKHKKKVMTELKMAITARQERKKETVVKKRPNTSSTLRSEMLHDDSLDSHGTGPISEVSSTITAYMNEELDRQILNSFTDSYIEDITETSKPQADNTRETIQLSLPEAKKIIEEELSKEVNIRKKISKLSPLMIPQDLGVASMARKATDGGNKPEVSSPQHYTNDEMRFSELANNVTEDFSDAYPMTRQDELIMEVDTFGDLITKTEDAAHNFTNGPKRDERSSTFTIVYKEPRWPHQVALDKIVDRLYQVKKLVLDDSELKSLRDISSLLPSLISLSVKNCGLKTLDGTLGFPNLQYLIASDNSIPHAAQCSFLSELQLLDLSGNPIDSFDEFSYLGCLAQLRTIKLYETKITPDPRFYIELRKRIPSLREIFPKTNFLFEDYNLGECLDDEEAVMREDDIQFLGFGNHGNGSMIDATMDICQQFMGLKSYGIGRLANDKKPPGSQKKRETKMTLETAHLINQIATPTDLYDCSEDEEESMYQMTDGEVMDSYRHLLESPKVDIDEIKQDIGDGDGEPFNWVP